MTNDEMAKYKGDVQAEMNELKVLPDQVVKELAAHCELYRNDPEKAHFWDPAVIGIPGGPVSCLLMEFKGRKTGNTLYTALQYYRHNGKIAIVASKGGTEDHPIWLLNLQANPACRIQVGKNSSPAIARVIEGAEHDEWWEVLVREQPIQRVYQSRTSRKIPVVVMEVPEGTVI